MFAKFPREKKGREKAVPFAAFARKKDRVICSFRTKQGPCHLQFSHEKKAVPFAVFARKKTVSFAALLRAWPSTRCSRAPVPRTRPRFRLCELPGPLKNFLMESVSSKSVFCPRKCNATSRLIGAKDHASVQINIGKVNANGLYTGEYETFVLSGYVRSMKEGDDSINRLASKAGFLNK